MGDFGGGGRRLVRAINNILAIGLHIQFIDKSPIHHNVVAGVPGTGRTLLQI